MCGIYGEVSFKNPVDYCGSARALENLRPRGPDAGGVFANDRILLGHRRLSVLDLSSASQQPMIDSELGLGIAFNGCIYNFKELRAELRGKGYRFFSDGDTEVILKSFHAWGPACLQRFKGMFAFALWERESGRVVLVRDRLGIKPLYFSENAERLRFASSLPALLASGDVDTTLDPVALHQFFSFHAAVPAPRTILRGVRKLPPATILYIEPDGQTRSETYWGFNVGELGGDRRLSEAEWVSAVDDALSASVARRTIADVPIGVLLSGGVDSSLIVAMLAQQGHDDIRTFSVGFDRVGDHAGDEFKYSNAVASQFGTKHQQIRIKSDAIIEALPATISAMSEPMVSHDAVAFYLLSQEVSKHVKVALSGQGADEVFGGYSWHPPFLEINDPLAEYKKRYFDWSHDDLAQLLSEQYLDEDHSGQFVEQFMEKAKSGAAIDRVLELDTKIMMVDDPVKRVDNMTMAFGLEARVPFLDHELVELAARIPARLKVESGGKYILKETARRYLSTDIIDRPKGYFPVPSLRYLQGAFLEYVREIFAQPAAITRGLYNRHMVEKMLAAPELEMSPKGHSRLWQAALLEGWLQVHGL
jgi:asparagine synthase (glutamine-hydrolysing)